MIHKHIINEKAKIIPTGRLPDGAVTGNGDLSVTWGGRPDRVELYIAKADFWHADQRLGVPNGPSPIGIVDIRMPYFAYSPYCVEENMDECKLVAKYTAKGFDATLTVIVHAIDNTILIEEDRTFPGLSTSMVLANMGEQEYCKNENYTVGDTQCISRTFDDENTYFTSSAFAAFRKVSHVRENGRERIRYAITVATNHDIASYKNTAMERLLIIDDGEFDAMVKTHERWWKDFWNKSSISIHDEELENMWYTGIYLMACCSRNRKFAPGIWGNYATSDEMWWGSDYHLDYNYQLPFLPFTAVNHTELMACYDQPLLDFLPRAKRYAKEYLGCRGAFYPVCLGPLGSETEMCDSTEHRSLFCGQKHDGAFAGTIMAMKWWGTRDLDYARNTAYPYLIEQANFWEDYLVFEDGNYVSYNDSDSEVAYWCGPDYMPQGQDHINCFTSIASLRVVLTTLLDMSKELGIDEDRREKWEHILAHRDYEKKIDGENVYFAGHRGGAPGWSVMWFTCLANEFGPYKNPEKYELAKRSFEKIHEKLYDDPNCFTITYAAAARLGQDPDMILDKYKEVLKLRLLPNGMVDYTQGGMEQSSSIPSAITEMLLQSYEHIIRLFPCWNFKNDASFKGLRAYGAFLVSAELKDGEISAEIVSEKGYDLSIVSPAGGKYVLVKGDERIELTDAVTTVKTYPTEKLLVVKA